MYDVKQEIYLPQFSVIHAILLIMLRFIVAEDDPIIQGDIVSQIKESGYSEVSSCSQISELKELLSDGEGGIVLLDCTLDNNESVFELNNIDLEKYVFIIVTGQQGSEVLKKSAIFNPIAFISKPFSRESLKFAITRAVEDYNSNANIYEDFSKQIVAKNLSSSDLSEELSLYVRNLRKDYDVTQQVLAEYLGISLRQIQRIEKGDNNFKLETLTILLRGVEQLKKEKSNT